ncbi:hypothetical protein DL95DRAFT_345425 [Leptodontidium sp. 2 PMI_412]|nr:hypothetical protein DL95DRAFT_345425 [Leptodontidium sp. 2 PMI_412]
MNYSRKRAVTACLRCRARKTKCDNQRPACGFCIGVGAQCLYHENSEHSSYNKSPLDASYMSGPVESDHTIFGATATEDYNLQWSTSASYLKIPSSRTTPDMILVWPIFEGKFPIDCLQAAIFDSAPYGMESDDDDGGFQTNIHRPFESQSVTYGLQEIEVANLTERFLSLVHTKNPILDESTLRQFANAFAENGMGWDGPSCLVLLACALGTIASPFEEAHAKATSDPLTFRQLQPSNNGPNLKRAESYYLLARRRIGLLRPSIIASQCFFLSGVYLMYALRPVEAFHEFHQASIVFQIWLKFGRPSKKSSTAQRLEQRMYWSCFKSECEILSEIPLPESGIADFEYPHMFPSPPDPQNSSESPSFRENTIHMTPRQQQQEQSWYYYLSEIALRRIGNRVLNAFYRDDHQLWLNMEVPSMVKIGEEFMQLLEQWHEGLPSVLNYNQGDLSQLPSEELPFMIRVRVLEIRTWIFRPFLFYAVHHPGQAFQNTTLLRFVEQALLQCIRLIETNSIRHRHHGVWYTCRVSVSAAFSILAVAKTGTIPLPQGWQSAVQLAIETLLYWEPEGPGDLRLARTILEDLLSHSAEAINQQA